MDKTSYNPEIWGGIECTINRVKNLYFDQLEYSGHYSRRGDIDAIATLGINMIRYPVLWEKHEPQKNVEINWTWTEGQLNKLREKGIGVIAGLVHHGSGPSFTNLSDPQFPYLLASYAKKVAEKFPWINHYTPVNEPLTTARFSGLYGLWYPHHRSARAFLKMLINQLKGTVLSMVEIRKINPNASLVQTEDLGKTYSTPKLKYQANFENKRRWLTYDILCGRLDKQHPLWKYFIKNGITQEELLFFVDNPCTPGIFGFNYYVTSERFLDDRVQLYPQNLVGGNGRHRYADVEAVRVEIDEETGIKKLLKEAWNRYHSPMAITEVHLHCHREEQLRWFKYVWDAVCELKNEKIDIRGVTSWALLGSFGWNKLLTLPAGEYEPGAFDIRNGTPRATALVRFIKDLTGNNILPHPIYKEKGWWQRSSRILFGPVIKELRMKTTSNSSPVLIIGKNGTLGRAFAKACEERNVAYQLISRQDCDITNLLQVKNIIALAKPWAVINAAGYVRVDEAELDQNNCFSDNTAGPQNLAIACQEAGIRFITFSSDLVFDGLKNVPYIESDEPNPLNVYGHSKFKAEKLVMQSAESSLIIRTSAFFGPWDEFNFVHYVRKALQNGESIKVANNIFISPTYVPHLVHATLDLLVDHEKGIWHLSNKGSLTWSEFAFRIAHEFDMDRSLIDSKPGEELGYIARRPYYSVLGSEKGQLLPTLDNALEQYIKKEKTEKRKVA
jgi:dTDP-4-dehydrorhamnose reductase